MNRYQRLRTTQRSLNNILTDKLPRGAEEQCGKALGMYQDGTLFFDSEDEIPVLIDYCIYDYWWDGHNTIERYVAQTPVDPGSDEGILLEAMLGARYSLFRERLQSNGIDGRYRMTHRDNATIFVEFQKLTRLAGSPGRLILS